MYIWTHFRYAVLDLIFRNAPSIEDKAKDRFGRFDFCGIINIKIHFCGYPKRNMYDQIKWPHIDLEIYSSDVFPMKSNL